MYMKESIVRLMTLMIVVMNFKLLSNLVTRKTLNVLKIRTARNADTALLPPLNIIISTIEIDTMNPSKMLILSLIYPIGESAIIFSPISAMKT